MRVKLADKAGFCVGVKRAMEMVQREIDRKEGPVVTYGPMIHNDQVIRSLEEQGVRVIHSASELMGKTPGTVLIRSHGITEAEQKDLEKTGWKIADATCGFVKLIHDTVKKYSADGYQIIIVGKGDHAEVQGTSGWCQGNPPWIIDSREEALALPAEEGKKVCVTAQTTYNSNKFHELVEILEKKGYDIVVRSTICSATLERQNAARTLASEVDAMVVIGGKSSSNTRKLYEICRGICSNTYFIQTKEDLDSTEFRRFDYVGITAGASTPNNIIEEVQTYMAEEKSFEQLLDESFKPIRNGEIVEGTVIDVKPDEIILNIGYKSDGIITRKEYSNDRDLDLTTVAKPGDTIEVKVVKINDGEGQVILSKRRVDQERGSERLRAAAESGEVLKAKVTQVLSGGLIAVVDESRVFIPASLVTDIYERDLNKYKGQEIEFVITEFNPRKRRIIGDRKQLIVAEKARKQKELLERINIGDVMEGTVKNITDFGVFIDLGGADGLLHISEMSWGRVENPRKLYKVGDKVKVMIKDIRDTKIALTAKFPEDNPWNDAAEKFAPGTIIKGKVARMTDFGAFVELTPGVDALLHVSQISREHVNKPSDVLEVGQEIEAKIVDFNEAEHKISLSMKALENNRRDDDED